MHIMNEVPFKLVYLSSSLLSLGNNTLLHACVAMFYNYKQTVV